MAESAAFIPKAIEYVKQAVTADNEEDYPRALHLYQQSLEYFMTGLKYEKNEKSKQMIRTKVDEYFKRAEELKELLENPNKKKEKKSDKKNDKDSHKEDKEVTKGDENEDEMDAETKKLQESISHAILTEKPNVKWSDVAGLEVAKSLIREAVMLPLRFPQLFQGKLKPWKGILLYGPPGTGKSHLARAVATEVTDATFFSVSSSDLVSKFQGESEKLVRNLWELARRQSYSIIFIDEIDSLASARGDNDNDSTKRIKTELLVQFNGVGKSNDHIIVLGATNTPWSLDPAVRRRFEKRVYIPLPEEHARKTLLQIHMGKNSSVSDEQLMLLAKRTEGFSGADMSILVREALMEPIRTMQEATHFKKVPHPSNPNDFLFEPCSAGDPAGIEMELMSVPSDKLKPTEAKFEDFLKAMKNSRPSVSQDDLGRYEEWTKEFGQDG